MLLLHDLAGWFIADGWVCVLAALNLLLVVRALFWMHATGLAVYRLEARFEGLRERLQYAVNKASDAHSQIRRITGEFPAVAVEEEPAEDSDPSAPTRIREP